MLRLALGGTFLWAGLGKVFTQIEVSGDNAAILGAMGVASGTGAPVMPLTPPEAQPQDPSRPQPTEPLPSPGGTTMEDGRSEGPAIALAAWSPAPRAFVTLAVAAPAPEPIKVERLYGIALLIHKSANPPADASGVTPMPLWPSELAQGSTPVYFAWAAAITEIVAGTLVVLGLFTRMSAFSLAGTMLVAIWLTEIGPAVQSGDAILGFLPRREVYAVAMSPGGYVTLMWQCALLAIGLALTTLGGGRLSLDAALFGGSAPAPKPAPKPPSPSPKPM
jgi:uncharacterized membrane protein YphA (DoxX/SURF4 family)